MSEDVRNPTCEEFQNQIAELVGSGANIESHPHAKVCAICSQLLHDFRSIAESAQHFRFGLDESGPDDWSEST